MTWSVFGSNAVGAKAIDESQISQVFEKAHEMVQSKTKKLLVIETTKASAMGSAS